MKVILHGFGTFSVFFWHLIRHAQTVAPHVQWSIILTTDHQRDRMVELLGTEKVLVLPPRSDGGRMHEALTSEQVYPGRLFQDIEAEKMAFKFDAAESQCERAMCMYRSARVFFERIKPDIALVSQVEGFDGKLFIALAKEFGAEVVVPTGCRNLGGIFFSPDDIESLPSYASTESPEAQAQARQYLESFRTAAIPASTRRRLDGEVLPNLLPGFPRRVVSAVGRWLSGRQKFDWWQLRVSFLNNLPWLRDTIWAARTYVNQRHCDLRSLDELPGKFIFYPLQYTPESSINTPAPYFVEQLRAIDAIRFAMPSDCRLVVKEHPACIQVRSADLVKRLRRRAGVLVAHYAMNSIEIVKRADLTISVTGTATLEAMLLGKPALTLGGSLASGFLGGICGLDNLHTEIECRLGRVIDDETIVNALAMLFSVRHEVNFGSPGCPGEPVLRKANVERFLQVFLDHCQKTGRGSFAYTSPLPAVES